jgi:hypothetical protein
MWRGRETEAVELGVDDNCVVHISPELLIHKFCYYCFYSTNFFPRSSGNPDAHFAESLKRIIGRALRKTKSYPRP